MHNVGVLSAAASAALGARGVTANRTDLRSLTPRALQLESDISLYLYFDSQLRRSPAAIAAVAPDTGLYHRVFLNLPLNPIYSLSFPTKLFKNY